MEKLLTLLRNINEDVDFASETELVDKGIFNSLDFVNIILAIEQNFGVEIDPDEIDPDNFQSVEAMWKMIQKKLAD